MESNASKRDTIYRTLRVGATIVHTPIRTPEQEAARLEELDRAVRRVLPGWRLRPKPTQKEAP